MQRTANMKAKSGAAWQYGRRASVIPVRLPVEDKLLVCQELEQTDNEFNLRLVQ